MSAGRRDDNADDDADDEGDDEGDDDEGGSGSSRYRRADGTDPIEEARYRRHGGSNWKDTGARGKDYQQMTLGLMQKYQQVWHSA